jgi:hypothetical protein
MRRFNVPAVALTAAVGLVPLAPALAGPFVITGSVGGAPTGVSRENFNSLKAGDTSPVTLPSGIAISFNPDAQPVVGAASGLYAAPYLSGGNGGGFGTPDQSNGADQTVYITTGSTGSFANAEVTLQLPGPERYFGLLWGSVDAYNTLSFYSGTTLIGSVTGSDVTASPNGDQGVSGTLYVNINVDTKANPSLTFDRVVATSSQYAFEFDDVAFNPTTRRVPGDRVPEPMSLGILAAGMVGIGLVRRRATR